jgi:hypothetical protein
MPAAGWPSSPAAGGSKTRSWLLLNTNTRLFDSFHVPRFLTSGGMFPVQVPLS